ncbi:hypothetical protein [Sphingomonas sp.]|uniref:hypothetical protein n=1 Tax=Sphingomonas sp. TaxID=28214 RepID=UPI000DBBFA36|nr:hypothetical protein [Sphingomonas sp.]PZT93979.1 MAG: hypothetical protein DI625_07445 [Sphingomonas sp.]
MEADQRSWLENRLHAAVDDDFYLDRDEEKRIKEEAAGRGMAIRDIETAIQTELKKSGAVSERLLVDELERMLRQFTDNDRLLDRKEERDAFDHVVRPAAGKRKGLDPQVAEAHVASFCRVHGIRRQTAPRTLSPLVIGGIAAAALILVVVALLTFGRSEGEGIGPIPAALSQSDKVRVDDDLRRAAQYVDQAQYTDPPERSAKAMLDDIALLDPQSSYRSEDVNSLKRRIVDHYLALADRSAGQRDLDGARRWLDRARLLKANDEGIREKARQLGVEP